jgi:hypothetical protein
VEVLEAVSKAANYPCDTNAMGSLPVIGEYHVLQLDERNQHGSAATLVESNGLSFCVTISAARKGASLTTMNN